MSRVYIATYRRPEMLQRCAASLLQGDLPITIVMPEDEVDSVEIVSPGVDVIALPMAQCGVWQNRWVAGEDAIKRGLESFVLTDDDCEFNHVDALPLMLAALDRWPALGAVSRKGSWPLTKPHSGDAALGLNGKLGIVWAQRTSAYIEVGGIDQELPRIGDYDLWLRLRIAGWEVAEHREAVVKHDNYRPEDDAARLVAGRRIQAKFPEMLRLREDGFVSLLPGRLATAQRDYAAGVFALQAAGAVYPQSSDTVATEAALAAQKGK